MNDKEFAKLLTDGMNNFLDSHQGGYWIDQRI